MGLVTTPRTWVASEVVTATELNTEVRDAITGIQAAWVSSAPVFSGGVTVGNGTSSQSYRQIGKTVEVRGEFTLGSTSAFTASVVLEFPIAISSGYVIHTSLIGAGVGFDNSALNPYPLDPYVVSLTTAGLGSLAFVTSPSGVVNATAPFVWAVNDILSWGYTMEAA